MKRLILIMFLAISLKIQGQQAPQFSQYLFNGVVINPAYAGSRESVNINGLYRKQWVRVNGSPSSQTLSADLPILYNKGGAGLFILHDELGAQFQSSVVGSFAYRIKLSSKARLAFGTGLGYTQLGIDGSKLTTDQLNDPAVPLSRMTSSKFDLQLGLYLNSPKYFVGLSMADIFHSNKSFLVPNERTHVYLTSGFVAKLNDKFKLRPSFLIKEDFKGPTNTDLTAFVIFKDFIWLGSSYRTRLFRKDKADTDLIAKDAVVFMIELFPIKNLRIGYGYDLSLTAMKNYPTHEISIGYNFVKDGGTRMLSPRYF